MFSFEHGGIVEIKSRLTRVKKGFRERMGQAVFQELDIERVEAQRLVPYLTGDLHDSIRVEGPFETAQGVYATLRAGNETVGYAIPVHEDPDAFHPRGEYKFIERPLMESAPYMASRISVRFQSLGGFDLI